jgi:hypothetical protein
MGVFGVPHLVSSDLRVLMFVVNSCAACCTMKVSFSSPGVSG